MRHYVYNLGQRFEIIVSLNKNKTAIRYPDGKQFTYDELDKLSDRYASMLTKKGVGLDDVAALFNDKSIECFAVMIACLKLGITYTNLDINSPADRLNKILDRCKPTLLFVDPKLNSSAIDSINFSKDKIIFLSETKTDGLAENKIDHEITGSTAAYIMFTSGSTGFPKGAVMTHANVLNLIDWSKETFSLSDSDISTNVNPVYFDNSVFDFYSAVFNGGTLIPFDYSQTRNPHELVSLVEKTNCTIWFSVPSLLVYLLTTKAISKNSMPAMKKIIFGGEGFPKPKLKKLYELLGDRIQLVNVYGPTECTCICSSYIISKKDLEQLSALAPLGRLAPNFSYEIIPLHEDEPMTGELCLKGPNVGMGYYNDPERTQNSFIQNSFNKNYREIVYKTGDLVKLDEEGQFHFLGRADNQIKHMGYRIELEEIEADLNSIHGVKESAVVYKPLGEGLGNIIAFVAGNGDLTYDYIMQEIKKKVPEYMVPKKIHILDILPKNSNGKIDRVELKQRS